MRLGNVKMGLPSAVAIDEQRVIERAAVCDGGVEHGHLQRGDAHIALSDRCGERESALKSFF